MSELRLVLELLGDDAHEAELPATGTLVVGSSRERAGFVVEGPGIDDAHCAIGRTREGDWAVKDLGSRTGTILNGQRVSSARLKPGDQLVLGARRLEVRPVPAPARAADAEAARPGDLPQRIGGYRIERLIGKGGMGSVYLAVQESLRRPVALKVLAPRLAADRDFVHRFQAEARAAAALSHPNVVVVYDVGEDGGSHYLSMEFMAGGSLEQKLAASGPLPWRTALGVLGDAAAGLAYAESRGIVHRDIKPANLMYSGTGAVKIADLGLATTLEQEANEAGDGRKVYGTPHFISPEQARGEAVDHRSDLYSLGATMYRLLSGRTPFERPTTREILRALQAEEPRSLRSFVPYLPAELEALVERLMAKDPNERPATAESLRRECERLRLMAEHGPALEQRSSRAGLWIGLLLVLGAAGAGGWFVLRPKKAPAPADPGLAARRPDEGPGPEADDPSFFGNRKDGARPAPDEEELVRQREREASSELGALTPLLTRNERRAALLRITERYAGTEAARAAQGELSALEQPPEPDSAEAAAASLEEVRTELGQRLLTPPPGEPARTLAERLRELDDYRPEASIAAEFEALRAELATALVAAERDALQGELARANQHAQRGQFAELRALLAGLAPRFTGLEALGGDPARLAPVLALRGEIDARAAGVDAEERSYHSQVERANRLAVGAALGPGSGFLTELANLDFDALDRRLAELPRPQRERPLCQGLIQDLILARGAFDSLRREFAAGTPASAGKGWRRKSVLDPRSKKVREVRDVRPDCLVFDSAGALENVPWREARFDPEWWSQLFQGRLSRDWTSDEVRGILALLRLMGAARGAELARAILVPSGILAAPGGPAAADLQAIAAAFDATAPWLEDAGGDALAAREAIAHERAAAGALSATLTLSGKRSWSDCAAGLERLLAEKSDTFLVGLLSNGSEWRVERKPPAAPKPEAGAPTATDAPKDGK